MGGDRERLRELFACPEMEVLFTFSGTGANVLSLACVLQPWEAALCADAETARGARRWNDANVLALSLRTTSPALLEEILDGWFDAGPSEDADDRANIRHVDEIA